MLSVAAANFESHLIIFVMVKECSLFSRSSGSWNLPY